MRAAVAEDGRRVRPARLPRPDPGPDEVRVQVEACGLCGSDLHLHGLGLYAPGVVPGHEMAGRVDAVGPEVDGLAPGDPVAVEPLYACGRCAWCRAGQDPLCPEGGLFGVSRPGGFAEYAVVPARRAFRLPADLDPGVAALAEPAAVAIHGLRRGGLVAGERVLVLGAGAVGLLCVAAARFLGAGEVAISARHPHQAERARRLGADRVLSEQEASPEALAAVPPDDAPPLVVETVGGTANTLQASVAAVRRGGRVSVLGLFIAPVSLFAHPLFMKEASLVWSNCYVRHGERADFHDAVALLDAQRDRLAEIPSHAVPLDEVERAYALASDKASGVVKVRIVP